MRGVMYSARGLFYGIDRIDRGASLDRVDEAMAVLDVLPIAKIIC